MRKWQVFSFSGKMFYIFRKWKNETLRNTAKVGLLNHISVRKQKSQPAKGGKKSCHVIKIIYKLIGSVIKNENLILIPNHFNSQTGKFYIFTFEIESIIVSESLALFEKELQNNFNNIKIKVCNKSSLSL